MTCDDYITTGIKSEYLWGRQILEPIS